MRIALRSFATIVVILAGARAASAAIVFSEDFTGQNGKGAAGKEPRPGVVIDVSGVTWSVDVDATDLATDTDVDFFRVVDERLVGKDLDGEAIWKSPVIGISGFTNLALSLDAIENGNHESSDYFDVFYSIDGGPETLVADFNGLGSAVHTLIDDWSPQTVTISGFTGSTLQVVVHMKNSANDENLILDNVQVTGSQVPEPGSLCLWSVLTGLAAYFARRRRKTCGGYAARSQV